VLRALGRWLRGEPRKARPAAAGDPARVAEVEALLDGLRPLLAADGGDVELVAVEGGRVRLRLVGACRSCSVRPQTLGAIEPELRRGLPWLEELEELS